MGTSHSDQTQAQPQDQVQAQPQLQKSKDEIERDKIVPNDNNNDSTQVDDICTELAKARYRQEIENLADSSDIQDQHQKAVLHGLEFATQTAPLNRIAQSQLKQTLDGLLHDYLQPSDAKFEILLEAAKARYTNEMDLRTINPKYMEEATFKAQHTLAVESATKLIVANNAFTVEQKKALESAFEAMFLIYNQVNLQKKASHVPAIGIDLGTTFCCMAVFRNRRSVEIIPNELDVNKTPSYVTYPAPAGGSHDNSTDSDSYQEDGLLFGDTARELAYANLKGTIYDVKRMLGRLFTDPRLERDRAFWSFGIENDSGDIVVRTPEGIHSPLEILTELLKHLKIQADAFLNGNVVSAVVTIPAYCNRKQRELTKQACHDAGLNVLQLVNEPTAAAVAYSLHKKERNQAGTTNCVVFDFGGGTFDVAVLTISQNQVVVQAVGGDDHLGGQDIDNLMVNYCLEQFKEKHGADADILMNLLTADPKEKIKIQNRIRRLKNDCERKKCHLSGCNAVVVSVDAMHAGKELVVTITRDTFNSLTKHIFKKCIDTLGEVLQKSKFSKESIDEIVLVGGSSRIPRVKEIVSTCFGGKTIFSSIDADEAVAHGAALLAYHAQHVEVTNVLVQEQEVQEDDATHMANTSYSTPHKLVICTDGGTNFLNFTLAPVALQISVKGMPVLRGAITKDSVKSCAAVGISLGLHNACVFAITNGEVTVIRNEHGHVLTPFTIGFPSSIPMVGYEVNFSGIPLEDIACETRSIIERPFFDPVVQSCIKRWPFKVRNVNNRPFIHIGGFVYSPEKISTFILSYMQEQAEINENRSLQNAVITVPIHFNCEQRRLTKEAGLMAGFRQVHILDEPTAVAIAYAYKILHPSGYQKHNNGLFLGNKNVIILDLDRTTLTLTLVTILAGVFEVRAVYEDSSWGTDTLVTGIDKYCIQEFQRKHRIDLDHDPQPNNDNNLRERERFNRQKLLERLRSGSVQTFQHLCHTAVHSISLQCFYKNIDMDVQITREVFKRMSEPYFKGCIEQVDNLIRDAHMDTKDISDIILIRSQSKIKALEEKLTQYFGGKICCNDFNDDEGIAYGAAVKASQLDPLDPTKWIQGFPGILPFSVRIQVEGDCLIEGSADLCEIFSRNTKLPCLRKMTCTTRIENQSSFTIKVYQGEETSIAESSILEEFYVTMPPFSRNGEMVTVTFQVGSDGDLVLEAECQAFDPKNIDVVKVE